MIKIKQAHHLMRCNSCYTNDGVVKVELSYTEGACISIHLCIVCIKEMNDKTKEYKGS